MPGLPRIVLVSTLLLLSISAPVFFGGAPQNSVPQNGVVPGLQVRLDFGNGTPIPALRRQTPGMQAWLHSPVREAAVVYVNGQRAGSVWHSPYSVDVTEYLHPGENTLRIVVGNLAINEMAGATLPDYRLLNSRYGVRATPQDMENLQVLPSGLLDRSA